MAALAILTFVLLPIFPYRKTHSYIAAPGFVACIWFSLNSIKVIYDPGFDKNRLSVFCQNHVNLIDAHIASKAIPHPFCGLMHTWQFKIPFYGWLMKMSRGIAVDKSKKNNFQNMVDQAKQRKEEGFSILTFPEGGRTLDGHVKVFRKGVLFMARDADYPVVPIAVKGSFDINRKGSLLFRPFHHIEVYVGPQFETFGLSDMDMESLSKILRDWIETRVNSLEEKQC